MRSFSSEQGQVHRLSSSALTATCSATTSCIRARLFLPAGPVCPRASGGGLWLAVSLPDCFGSGILSDLWFVVVSVSLIHWGWNVFLIFSLPFVFYCFWGSQRVWRSKLFTRSWEAAVWCMIMWMLQDFASNLWGHLVL